MSIFKKYTAFALLAVAGSPIYAQNSPLKMDSALNLALKNNASIKAQLANQDEWTAKLKTAKAARLPDLKVSGAYLRVSKPNVDLKIPLGGGGSGGSPTTLNINEMLYGMGNASLPLFAGGKINYSIKATKLLAEANNLDIQNQKSNVLLNVVSAYCNYYKAQKTAALFHEHQNISERRVKETQEMMNNGLLAKNDLLKVQLQHSNIQLAVLEAESQKETAMIALNMLIGNDPHQNIALDSSFINFVPTVKSVVDWENTALNNRPELQSQDMKQKAAEYQIKIAKADYLPQIALTGGYIAAYVPNLITLTNAVNVGLGVNYAISNFWKNGSKVAEAKTRQAQLNAQTELVRQNVILNINSAYQAAILQKERINLANVSIEQARENYKIVVGKQKNNLATVQDLLDADYSLLQSEINLETAKSDAYETYQKLKVAAGMDVGGR